MPFLAKAYQGDCNSFFNFMRLSRPGTVSVLIGGVSAPSKFLESPSDL